MGGAYAGGGEEGSRQELGEALAVKVLDSQRLCLQSEWGMTYYLALEDIAGFIKQGVGHGCCVEEWTANGRRGADATQPKGQGSVRSG